MERTEQEEIDLIAVTVDTFAAQMKDVLTKHVKDGKRGWLEPDRQRFILNELLGDAYALYDHEPMPQPIAVDVANRAMFIWAYHQLAKLGVPVSAT